MNIRILDVRTDAEPLEEFLASRQQIRADVSAQIEQIGEQVCTEGWKALAELTERFDGVRKDPRPEAFQVPEEAWRNATSALDPDLESAIETAIHRVRAFHSKQKRPDWFHEEPGIRTGQMFRPLERVGVYAPSGTAPLFSTLIMDTVPAQVAGCNTIVVCSPPQRESGTVHPLILATCRKLGLERSQVWSMGSAWAVFAMAYGLEGFPAVDGVFGPGNVFVMEAKRQVQGHVRIESLPGNSEILVVADDSADPRYVAADLLSQAEHAGGEMSVLVTPSRSLLDRVETELKKQLERMERREIAESSLSTGGALVLVRDLDQGCEIANRVAPEHLEIQTKEPEGLLKAIRHAGAVFIGSWSTEPIGDYTAGTNHVLPTGGTARFSSALSVDDFLKKISVVHLEKEGMALIGPAAMKLAEAEGLQGHKQAVQLRMEDL